MGMAMPLTMTMNICTSTNTSTSGGAAGNQVSCTGTALKGAQPGQDGDARSYQGKTYVWREGAWRDG